MAGFLRGNVALMGAFAIFSLSSFAIHAIIGRSLGPVEYGIFATVFSVILSLQVFLVQGMPEAMSREVAQGAAARGVFRAAIIGQALLSGIAITICLILGFIFKSVSSDPTILIYFLLASAIIPLRGMVGIFRGLLNGQRRFQGEAKLLIVYSIARVLVVGFLMLLSTGIVGAIGGLVLASIAPLVVGYFLIDWEAGLGAPDWPRLFRTGLPMMLFFFFLAAASNMDLLLVKVFYPGVTTGGYAAAWVLSRAPSIVMASLTATLLPTIAALQFKGDLRRRDALFEVSFRMAVVAGTIMTILTIVFGSEIIYLVYGSGFPVSAAPIFGMLTGAVTMMTLILILTNALYGVSGGSRVYHIGISVGLLAALLIPTGVILWGIYGAAVAAIAVFGIVLLLTTRIHHLTTGQPDQLRWVVLGALIVVGIAGLGQLVGSYGLDPWVTGVLLLMLAFAALIITRMLGREDLQRFLRIFA